MKSPTITVKLPSDQVFTDEADLLKKVIEWLEPQQRDGIKVLRICDGYTRGYADLFICVHGIFVCAELKDDIGVASPHQEQFLEDMAKAGAICGVCRTVKEVAYLVDDAKRRCPAWTRTKVRTSTK